MLFVCPVTGIGFVCWDFSKVFSRSFRLDLDMAVLTLGAVIKNISKNVVFVLFLPHVFLQEGIKQVIQCAMHLVPTHKTYNGNRDICRPILGTCTKNLKIFGFT